MMRNRAAATAVAIGTGVAVALVLAWAVAALAILWVSLEPQQRHLLLQVCGPQLPLLIPILVLLALLAWSVVHPLYRRWVHAPAQITEQTLSLVARDENGELQSDAYPNQRDLIAAINMLARQRNAWRRDTQQQVAVALQQVANERNRFAALMSELAQGVVVCNLDGRVLLYNARARLQFKALSPAPMVADGADMIGLGRSIHAVLERRLIAHALASVMHRLRRGADNPVARFVSVTRAGHLMRVQLAPVRDIALQPWSTPPPDAQDDGSAPQRQARQAVPATQDGAQVTGYVLLIENVSAEFAREHRREHLFRQLTDGLREPLSVLREAIPPVADGASDTAEHGQSGRVAAAQLVRIGELLAQVSDTWSREPGSRWPLEDMLGAELLDAARRCIGEAGITCAVTDPQDEIWLQVDGFTLLVAVESMAGRLLAEYQVTQVDLSLTREQDRARLAITWRQAQSGGDDRFAWESLGLVMDGAHQDLTLRELVERHHGELEFHHDPVTGRACLGVLLPLAPAAPVPEAGLFLHGQSRPEFYDFDLFATSEQVSTLDQQPLTQLSFTVFDTETTGLEPSAGDEIIQIGAVRIVNGRLLRSEAFEQLVDPRRPIPRASIPIHGIEPQMLVGKPVIDEVLPAFHAYAQDTVLVAHNAAFDLRFLQLKQQRTGIEFSQPVLDTLLLSAFVQPNQDSHRLEAIAERFGIPVIGRHTALGDAIVTAEVLLRLIPLLAARGIHTLAQARQASRKTWYARLRY